MNKTQLEVFLEILEQSGASFQPYQSSESTTIDVEVHTAHEEITFIFNLDGSIKTIN